MKTDVKGEQVLPTWQLLVRLVLQTPHSSAGKPALPGEGTVFKGDMVNTG